MRRSAAASPGVSLFPFLAVLLCTMGALVVVLVVINRQVRQKAAAAVSHSAAQDEEVAIAEEQLSLQLSQLTTAREKTLADLNQARRRLSGIEDHSRRIKRKIEDLQAAAKQLPDPSDAATVQRDALRAELMRLNTERLRLEAALNEARSNARYRKPSFAVVPFGGIHKTHRRPIYLECRADSVVLQPEGIVFKEADFIGPNGPSNPLAAALRAAREYWSQQPPPSADVPNEPYPLLLVRPDGILMYEKARFAMMSWDDEFGYELVDSDWELAYPEQPDPRLVEMEQLAAADARRRLLWLARFSPEQLMPRQTARYRVSPSGGGLVREGGGGLSAGESGGRLRSKPAGGPMQMPLGTPQPNNAAASQPMATAEQPMATAEQPSAEAPKSKPARSIAESRGRNWALPSGSNSSVPITRPVRLQCWPDRIVVMSDSRDEQPQVVPLAPRTEDSVDQLVVAVQEHTKRWGIAGRGMYWKPQLSLEVYPNGDGRADDLQLLLANSGLDVKRR